MKIHTLADRFIVWTFVGSVLVIASHISWLRELFVIWMAVSVPFVLFPVFGSIVGPRLQRLQRSRPARVRVRPRPALAPNRVRASHVRPFLQEPFHHKDFSIN